VGGFGLKSQVDFSSVKKKADHYSKKADVLLQEISKIYTDGKYKITTELSAHRKTCDISLTWLPVLNFENFSIEFFFIIHGFRTVLDNLIFCTILNVVPKISDHEKKQIYFPIIKSEDKWSNNNTVLLLTKYCDPKFLNLLENCNLLAQILVSAARSRLPIQ